MNDTLKQGDMKQVTKEEFYEALMSETKDVILNIRGAAWAKWPYTTDFTYRNSGKVFGTVVGSLPEGQVWPEIKTYYRAI